MRKSALLIFLFFIAPGTVFGYACGSTCNQFTAEGACTAGCGQDDIPQGAIYVPSVPAQLGTDGGNYNTAVETANNYNSGQNYNVDPNNHDGNKTVAEINQGLANDVQQTQDQVAANATANLPQGQQTPTVPVASATALTALQNAKCDVNFGLCQAIDPQTGVVTGWVPADKPVFCDQTCALAARMNVIIGTSYTTATLSDGTTRQIYDRSLITQQQSLTPESLSSEQVAAIKKTAEANKIQIDAQGNAIVNLTEAQIQDLQQRVDSFYKQQDQVQKDLATDIQNQFSNLLANCDKCTADQFTINIKGQPNFKFLTSDYQTAVIASARSQANIVAAANEILASIGVGARNSNVSDEFKQEIKDEIYQKYGLPASGVSVAESLISQELTRQRLEIERQQRINQAAQTMTNLGFDSHSPDERQEIKDDLKIKLGEADFKIAQDLATTEIQRQINISNAINNYANLKANDPAEAERKKAEILAGLDSTDQEFVRQKAAEIIAQAVKDQAEAQKVYESQRVAQDPSQLKTPPNATVKQIVSQYLAAEKKLFDQAVAKNAFLTREVVVTRTEFVNGINLTVTTVAKCSGDNLVTTTSGVDSTGQQAISSTTQSQSTKSCNFGCGGGSCSTPDNDFNGIAEDRARHNESVQAEAARLNGNIEEAKKIVSSPTYIPQLSQAVIDIVNSARLDTAAHQAVVESRYAELRNNLLATKRSRTGTIPITPEEELHLRNQAEADVTRIEQSYGQVNGVGFNSAAGFQNLLDLSLANRSQRSSAWNYVPGFTFISKLFQQDLLHQSLTTSLVNAAAEAYFDTAPPWLLTAWIRGPEAPKSFLGGLGQGFATAGQVWGAPQNPNFQAKDITEAALSSCGVAANSLSISPGQSACLTGQVNALKFKWDTVQTQNTQNAALQIILTGLNTISGGTIGSLGKITQAVVRTVDSVGSAVAFAGVLSKTDNAYAHALRLQANASTDYAIKPILQQQAKLAEDRVHQAYVSNILVGVGLSAVHQIGGHFLGEVIHGPIQNISRTNVVSNTIYNVLFDLKNLGGAKNLGEGGFYYKTGPAGAQILTGESAGGDIVYSFGEKGNVATFRDVKTALNLEPNAEVTHATLVTEGDWIPEAKNGTVILKGNDGKYYQVENFDPTHPEMSLMWDNAQEAYLYLEDSQGNRFRMARFDPSDPKLFTDAKPGALLFAQITERPPSQPGIVPSGETVPGTSRTFVIQKAGGALGGTLNIYEDLSPGGKPISEEFQLPGAGQTGQDIIDAVFIPSDRVDSLVEGVNQKLLAESGLRVNPDPVSLPTENPIIVNGVGTTTHHYIELHPGENFLATDQRTGGLIVVDQHGTVRTAVSVAASVNPEGITGIKLVQAGEVLAGLPARQVTTFTGEVINSGVRTFQAAVEKIPVPSNIPCALVYDQTPQKTALVDSLVGKGDAISPSPDKYHHTTTNSSTLSSLRRAGDLHSSPAFAGPIGLSGDARSLGVYSPHKFNITDWFGLIPSARAAGGAPCGTFNISDPKLLDLGTFEKRNDGLYFENTKITKTGVLVTTTTGDYVKISLSDPDSIYVDNQPGKSLAQTLGFKDQNGNWKAPWQSEPDQGGGGPLPQPGQQPQISQIISDVHTQVQAELAPLKTRQEIIDYIIRDVESMGVEIRNGPPRIGTKGSDQMLDVKSMAENYIQSDWKRVPAIAHEWEHIRQAKALLDAGISTSLMESNLMSGQLETATYATTTKLAYSAKGFDPRSMVLSPVMYVLTKAGLVKPASDLELFLTSPTGKGVIDGLTVTTVGPIFATTLDYSLGVDVAVPAYKFALRTLTLPGSAFTSEVVLSLPYYANYAKAALFNLPSAIKSWWADQQKLYAIHPAFQPAIANPLNITDDETRELASQIVDAVTNPSPDTPSHIQVKADAVNYLVRNDIITWPESRASQVQEVFKFLRIQGSSLTDLIPRIRKANTSIAQLVKKFEGVDLAITDVDPNLIRVITVFPSQMPQLNRYQTNTPDAVYSRDYNLIVINENALYDPNNIEVQRSFDHETGHQILGFADRKLAEEAKTYYGDNWKQWHRLILEARNEIITYYLYKERLSNSQPLPINKFVREEFAPGVNILYDTIQQYLIANGVTPSEAERLILSLSARGYQPLVDKLGGWDKFFEFFKPAEDSANKLAPKPKEPLPSGKTGFVEEIKDSYNQEIARPCGFPALGLSPTKKSALADSLTNARTDTLTFELSDKSLSSTTTNVNKGVDPRGVEPLPLELTVQTPHRRGPMPLSSIASVNGAGLPAGRQVLGAATVPCPLDPRKLINPAILDYLPFMRVEIDNFGNVVHKFKLQSSSFVPVGKNAYFRNGFFLHSLTNSPNQFIEVAGPTDTGYVFINPDAVGKIFISNIDKGIRIFDEFTGIFSHYSGTVDFQSSSLSSLRKPISRRNIHFMPPGLHPFALT